MAPTFIPGDEISVDTQAYLHKTPIPGDVIVVNDPEMRGRKLLKRVEKVTRKAGKRLIFVVGDNELRSRDSRQFGPIPLEEVLGRVLGTEPLLPTT